MFFCEIFPVFIGTTPSNRLKLWVSHRFINQMSITFGRLPMMDVAVSWVVLLGFVVSSLKPVAFEESCQVDATHTMYPIHRDETRDKRPLHVLGQHAPFIQDLLYLPSSNLTSKCQAMSPLDTTLDPNNRSKQLYNHHKGMGILTLYNQR